MKEMKEVTIVFPVTKRCIYLARKKLSWGKGYYNGYGGSRNNDESVVDCAVREFREECRATVLPQNIQKKGEIRFYEDQKLLCHAHIFLTYTWTGRLEETSEMGPAQEFEKDHLPPEMWPADKLWLPIIFSGLFISQGTVTYNKWRKKVLKFSCEAYTRLG